MNDPPCHGTGSAMLVSRRRFLSVGASCGGMVLALQLPLVARGASRAAAAPAQFEPNAFIRVPRHGPVVLIVDKTEVGQGVYTSLPMLMAEELELGLDQVAIQPAPADEKLYADPILHFQATGNSSSVRGSWGLLREAGAVARTLLVEAAARRWRVPPSQCRAARGAVTHGPSGRSLPYGALAAAAARLPVPEHVPLKTAQEFKLIGTSAPRLDIPLKVNGSAIYGIDVRLPGMGFASVRACPVFGGILTHMDDSRARTIPGVRKVVRLRNAIAVIADNTWTAMQALDAVETRWSEGALGELTTGKIVAQLEAASKREGLIALRTGNFAQALTGASRQLHAQYHDPFLSHAPMEPPTCVAHVHSGKCEIWTASQVQARAQATGAAVTGLPLKQVTVHNLMAGGAFGRRLETDFIEQAVRIASAVDYPVSLVWTREEDIRHDLYRPFYFDRMTAGLDPAGRLIAWHHRIVGSSVMARFAPAALGPDGLDPDAVECSAQPIYAVPNWLVDYVRQEPPGVITSFWRGVGPTHNVYVMESFMDECAAAAGRDPVEFRRPLLQQTPRALHTLEVAARNAGWGAPLPRRSGRGIAAVHVFGTYITVVVQVAVSPAGEVRLQRVVAAVDCGIVVDPDNTVAQIEGGILFGLSAALWNEIDIEAGRVVQTNFNDYRSLRMSETPPVEVHLVPNGGAPGGMGEVGTVAAAPALTNAIFAATGLRIRRLPVKRHALAET